MSGSASIKGVIQAVVAFRGKGDAHATKLDAAVEGAETLSKRFDSYCARRDTAGDGGSNYQAVLEKARAASAKFREAQRAYRAREIGDAAYLAARAEWEASEKEFSKARGEYRGDAEKLTAAQEAAFRSRLSELRSTFQDLHYRRVQIEKRARELKKAGDSVQEAAAWALAQQASQAEHQAEDQYKMFLQTMRQYVLS